jgi:hypothetical protein
MKKIPLTHGRFALVDDEDYDRLMAMGKWHLNNNGYAAKSEKYRKEDGSIGNRTILMHRFIMEAPKGMEIDHWDLEKLNNQQCNLRICTRKENARNQGKNKANTSGYKCVYWYGKYGKWVTQIRINNKQITLGYFQNIHDAAKAYNEAAIKHYGEFARLNEIPQ